MLRLTPLRCQPAAWGAAFRRFMLEPTFTFAATARTVICVCWWQSLRRCPALRLVLCHADLYLACLIMFQNKKILLFNLSVYYATLSTLDCAVFATLSLFRLPPAPLSPSSVNAQTATIVTTLVIYCVAPGVLPIV